jgi:hypothetical protein
MWGRNLKFEVLGHKMSRNDKCKISLQLFGKSSTKAEIIVTVILSPWDKSPWSSEKVSWTFDVLERAIKESERWHEACQNAFNEKHHVLKRESCWWEEESKRMPVVRECPSSPRGRSLAVASRTELGGPIKGSEWRYKVYDYDFGEKYPGFEDESRRRGQGFQKKSIIS